MTILFGAAGAAKDIEFLLHEYSADRNIDMEPDFIICNDPSAFFFPPSFKMLTEEELINKLDTSWKNEKINAFIGIGSGIVRKKIWNDFAQYKNISFPNLIHSRVVHDKREKKLIMGDGNIIMAGTVLTTNILFGNNNHVNINCSISHDCIIHNNVTLSPGVHVAGNVIIEDNTFIGAGAVILERIRVCENTIIGAGAVVNKNITEPGTFVGIPARKISK